ncbi:MAG: hypothetical protein WDN25_14340 [Acetobacteraceae bacterium]
MKRLLLASAAGLAVTTGAAFAAGVPGTPGTAQPAQDSFYSGYLFPDDGSPSGDEPTAIPVPQPSTPTGIGGLNFTHIFLFPPSEGADGGDGQG